MTDRLAELIARPKTHKVVISYDDASRDYEIPCISIKSAENEAADHRRNIGKPLKVRGTAKTVRIVSVEVVEISTLN